MAHKKTRLALLVALAVQHYATGAVAQNPDTVLPGVVVHGDEEPQGDYNPASAASATKIPVPLRDIPQTVNVVPQTLLRDQGARSLQDALKTVPGIGLSHGDGQRDQVTIRGFSAIGDQFIDGLRDDALYFRDLSNIDQVEVVKGPASVLYGRGSSGGLINRVTKKPGIDRSEVTAQFGSWQQRRGEFDLARNLGENGVAFRLTGAVERANSYREEQFIDRKAFSPSMSFQLAPSTRLLVQGEYLSDRRLTDFGVPAYQGRPVDVAPSTYYGAAHARDNDYTQTRVEALSFTLDHRFNDQWSVRNAFRHYDYSLDRNNTIPGTVNESDLTVSLNRSNIRREEDGYFNQTELTQKTEIGGLSHHLLYGLETGKQDKDQLFVSQSGIATVSLFRPVQPELPFDVPVAPSTDNAGILKTTGIYVQDMMTLSDKWKVLAGLRYDSFEQQTRERRAGQADLRRTDRAWSPRLGVVYQPSLTRSYYASFSRSFQPSAELFPLATSDADMAPEKTESQEIGAKFDFMDGKVSATAALFRLERTNIKSTDYETHRIVPIGVQRTNGLELTLSGELPHGWRIWSGYAYLDAEVTSSLARDAGQPVQGKRATLTPRHSANLWLVRTWGPGFSAGSGINYVSDRFANPGNTVTLPGYVTVDTMAGYRFNGVDLQLNIFNLFDRKYTISAHGKAANLNLPGAPRTVQLTARYRF